jgi:hypothetical protein
LLSDDADGDFFIFDLQTGDGLVVGVSAADNN